MGEPFSFVAYGTPQPQGSAKAFIRGNRAYVTSANPKMKPYRHTLTQVATEVLEKSSCNAPAFPRPWPVELSVVWYLAKPKSTPKKVLMPTKKPDTDKLLRAVLDSLTGVVYEDDSQVVRVTAEKKYGIPERTEVTAENIE
jgi:Holliday junction resolvase RusA-like endonuclease